MSKNTSDRDGFEVSGQLIPDVLSGNGEGTFTRLSLVDCLTWSLLLAEQFWVGPGTHEVVVSRFCR